MKVLLFTVCVMGEEALCVFFKARQPERSHWCWGEQRAQEERGRFCAAMILSENSAMREPLLQTWRGCVCLSVYCGGLCFPCI